MIEKIRNNRFFIVYLIPFLIGSMSVLSFQPFNFTLINFITLPVLFIILSYVRKKSKNNYRKKPFQKTKLERGNSALPLSM